MTSTQSAPALAQTLARHRRSRRVVLLTPLAIAAVVLLLWEAVATTGAVRAHFLPAPSAVAGRLWTEVIDGQLLGYTWVTLSEALLGSLLGAAVAMPLGYLIARNRWAAAGLQPYIAASQALPAVALAPLLALWLGYGVLPIVLLCALLVFFPILLATVLGLRTLDRDVVDAARLDGAHGWSMLRHIELPMSLPSLLTGLRNGFTLSVTGAVVGEFVMGGQGLGMVLSVQAHSADTTGLFATLTVLSLLAVLMYVLLREVERLTLAEQPTVRRRRRHLPTRPTTWSAR